MDRIFDAYNGIGGFSLEFMRKTRERMKWICEQVSGASVLDVGCSQGVCPILLGQAGFTVLGVDVNGEAVAFANEKLSGEDESVKKAVQVIGESAISRISVEPSATPVTGRPLTI